MFKERGDLLKGFVWLFEKKFILYIKFLYSVMFYNYENVFKYLFYIDLYVEYIL